MNITVFDNRGKTFDRYTIVDMGTGDVYGMSHNPRSPSGFNQFNGTVGEDIPFSGTVSEFIKEVVKDMRFGAIIQFSSLPPVVQRAIRERLE